MRAFLTSWVMSVAFIAQSQTIVEKSIRVSNQTRLDLNFPFADDINFEYWNKNEVSVRVEVTINDGEDDSIFELLSETSKETVEVWMEMSKWESYGKKRNCWNSEINYTIRMPSTLEIVAETISGNYTLAYTGKPNRLKTISGDIDLTVPKKGMDFSIKTISGEVYSDLEITYPFGEDGLRQLVGMDVDGQVYGGGTRMQMETISGNVYLRKE